MSTIRRPLMRSADYEDAKRVARAGSPAERAALARRQDMAPELLFYLAADHVSDVRVAVAANDCTPPQADRLLADDADERVRVALARKIATLAPQLDPNSQDRLQRLTAETLSRLVRSRDTQATAGNQLAIVRAPGIDFADVRPFLPGDRVKDVNWRATAKRGVLWVNDRNPDRSTDVILFLDTFSTRTLAASVRTTHTLASAYLSGRDRVGLITFGGTVAWVRPRMGRADGLALEYAPEGFPAPAVESRVRRVEAGCASPC